MERDLLIRLGQTRSQCQCEQSQTLLNVENYTELYEREKGNPLEWVLF